jgi:hypothetical protein
MQARWRLLMLACALASLLVPALASASTGPHAETRVGGLDLGNAHSIGAPRPVTLGTHQGYGPAYDDIASDSLLAARGAGRIVDANKLNHIFGKAGRNLEPLVEKFGSQEGAFNAVQDATQALAKSQGLSGIFKTTVQVGGQDLVVKGNVIDGVVHIDTFWPPVP